MRMLRDWLMVALAAAATFYGAYLALDRRQAAAIFGGGAKALSRYENGKTKPPLALVKLLKVLDRHPDLLSEVRAA